LVFTVEEKLLSKQLGIPREIIGDRRFKEMTRGVEWEKVNGKVCYTPDAAKTVLHWFVPSDIPVEVGVAPEFEVQITRIWPNTRVMEVVRTALANLPDNPQFRVRVKSNLNFLPGMIARAKHYPGDDLPTIVGKLPRKKGQW
jgi:hypothetical protein